MVSMEEDSFSRAGVESSRGAADQVLPGVRWRPAS
jgi:hypothetical protein